MTTETKNKILSMSREEHKSIRAISIETGMSLGAISNFLRKSEDIVRFVNCLNCGKEIPMRNNGGRTPMYCCSECKYEDYRNTKKRRHVIRVCEHCGCEYKQYSFVKSRFCSRACANKHRYSRIH